MANNNREKINSISAEDIQIIISSLFVVGGLLLTFLIEKGSNGGTSNMLFVFLGCAMTFLGADQLAKALAFKRRKKKNGK